MNLKKGALLHNGTYRIERMLGQGGFGITYLAYDLNLDRLVAIKEFFPKDYCDREASTSHVTLGTQSAKEFVNRLKAKFLKEARNIAKFDNPGIIKIHAAFEENNTAYYVMDYIEGMSLSEMVKRNGPLSLDRALRYIRKVGSALEYVHDHKINHLDVKPANIMVRSKDDNPILIDFGLSKQYDSSGNQTSTTPTGISHGFAPMEQYNDGGVREFSPQTDLYSLAATLYYLLSGVTPPQATKLVEDELTFPATIPVELIDPISKAMSPVRRQRHETIPAFLAHLDTLHNPNLDETDIVGDVVGPPPHDNPGPDPKPKSKLKLYLGIAAGVVALIVVIICVIPRGGKTAPVADSDSVTVLPISVEEASEAVANMARTVKDMYWDSPLGIASYTGEVTLNSAGVKVPDGKGVAKITSGEYKGSVYDGMFQDGVMEGEATYRLANGDTFKGTYKHNEYDTGRYTEKSTGEYFEGTFRNGQPAQGSWYSPTGKLLETL